MADQSGVGARNTLAPTHRLKQLLADFIVTNSIHFTIQVMIVLYMKFILNISFGEQIMPIFIVILAGTLAGNGLGLLIGMYGTKKFETNSGILTSFTMICCVLAGMMMVQLKYWIQVHMPILATINPANMITDALYANYYYGMNNRFYMNIFALLIFTFICYMIAYLRLRRKQYASI